MIRRFRFPYVLAIILPVLTVFASCQAAEID